MPVIKALFYSMKKFLITALAVLFVIEFSSCKVRKMDTSDKVNIVCSIFPEYDWARNILGDDDDATTLTLLEKNGVDLHSYIPSSTDLSTVADCNLLFYTGGKSHTWITDILNNSSNTNQTVINLMEVLKDQLKKDGPDATDYDEHLWLSVKNAKIACSYFTETLCQLLPDSADRYKSRLADYMKKLDAMDLSLQGVVQASQNKTLIICDRFPFRYLAEDYGIQYCAPFSSCAGQREPGAEAIDLLSETLVKLNSSAVVVLENSDKKIAKTVIGNAKKPNCDILTMDSMQSVTLRQSFAGVTYISQMQKNLESLQKALK